MNKRWKGKLHWDLDTQDVTDSNNWEKKLKMIIIKGILINKLN